AEVRRFQVRHFAEDRYGFFVSSHRYEAIAGIVARDDGVGVDRKRLAEQDGRVLNPLDLPKSYGELLERKVAGALDFQRARALGLRLLPTTYGRQRTHETEPGRGARLGQLDCPTVRGKGL